MHLNSPKNISSKFDAQLFSQQSRTMRSSEISDETQSIFPNITDLSLEIVAGETLIHAQVEGLREKIPLNELSSALNKYVSIALAILSNKQGIVCVDEIENNFYYKNHRQIFSSLMNLCERNDVQLFASTHSLEFIQAIGDLMHDKSGDFSLLRTDYVDNTCQIRQVDGSTALLALNQNVEVRG